MLLEERTAEFSYEYITRQWCDVEGLTMVRRWRDEGGRLRREERRVFNTRHVHYFFGRSSKACQDFYTLTVRTSSSFLPGKYSFAASR